ncbi:MAG: GAF domain-containing protein [Acidimicrobiales bacterium]|nr:GAF domain-containing protein [Acidimicrobiales bacterium]
MVALEEATAEEADNAQAPDSLLSDLVRTHPWLRNWPFKSRQPLQTSTPATVSAVPADNLRGRLDDLLALTEVGLGNLGLEDLLVELLDRVRDILIADTAAVLLIDEGGRDLVARAACGIEEEVHQGVRVPVGTGFAGSIAASKRPVLLDRVDETTVANPILYEKGIRVMLGVPLLSADRVIGVLHVGRLHDCPFNEDEAGLLGVVAERVSGAVQAHQLAVQRAAAMILERSLLRSTLPLCVGRGSSPLRTTVVLPPGGSLAFYTDGLVERRHEDLEIYLERLCAAATTDHPERVCSNVMRAMDWKGLDRV